MCESLSEGVVAPTQSTGDEELVVEGIIETAISSTSDFVCENGLPVGLDTAIVRCIERYGNVSSFFLILTLLKCVTKILYIQVPKNYVKNFTLRS